MQTIATKPPAAMLELARRWYEQLVDSVTRAWEPRFRHRQYRAWCDEDGERDDEVRPPLFEFEDALEALLFDQGETVDASACVVLAVSPQRWEDAQPICGQAACAIARDVLKRATELGYFAEPCPEALRFPDLPELARRDDRDDITNAEREVEEAQSGFRCAEMGIDGYDVEERRARLAEAEARLAGMKAGTIPALTGREKIRCHNERRASIVLAYKARLEAAGESAAWVEVPPRPYVEREAA